MQWLIDLWMNYDRLRMNDDELVMNYEELR